MNNSISDLISGGTLGQLIGFTGKATFYKPDEYFSSAPWRTRSGGGPLMINMIHEIQTMRTLMGEIISVSGFLSSLNRSFEVEDTGAFSILFDSGVIGTFYLTDTSVSPFSWEMTSGENPNFPHIKDEACYEIFGDKGTLTVPNLKLYSQHSSSHRSWLNPMEVINVDEERNDPLEKQLLHFCDVIESKAKPMVNLHSGMKNVFIIEKMLKSSLRVETDYLTAKLQSTNRTNKASLASYAK